MASGSYKIDPESLHSFLTENGFYSYKPQNVKTTILVHVENRKVRQVTKKEIREFCWRFIENEYQFSGGEERKQVKLEFHKNKSFFSPDNLQLLPEIEIREIKDTKDMSLLFFNNCILEITKDGVTKKEYDEFEGHVFETDIIDRDLKNVTKDPSQVSGVFKRFLNDISRAETIEGTFHNYQSIISIMGYMLHRFKNPGNAKAVILMDTYKNEKANGGTGKGIICKALDKVRKSAFIDGKFFQSSNRFSFANVDYGTRILVFDDVPQNFDFEKLFPVITEKALVERKYENPYEIPFEDSPKIILSTNYAIMDQGESDKRRKVEFVLSDTFNSKYTPEDKYGHLFFTEWDSDEWDQFYNLMAHAIRLYLKKGITKPKTDTAERKAIMSSTEKVVRFFHANIDFSVKYDKKEFHKRFYKEHPEHMKVEPTTFRHWLKAIADAYGYGFHESHSGDKNFFQITPE